MQIQCIVIEDEPLAQKLLENHISRIQFLKLLKVFTNPLDSMPFLRENDIDLIFLDIEMPEINGMNFLQILPNPPQIIFTTAYSQYAVESYEKNALDYLLKPITFERFLQAVQKFPLEKKNTTLTLEDSSNSPKADYIYIKTDRQILRLEYHDIDWIESVGDYVFFHTESHKYLVHHTLKKLEDTLPPQFVRIHHSYLINFDKISQWKDNHLYIGQTVLSVSKKYKDAVQLRIDSRLI
jgi:two-component system, LytTR family, response regulator